ncbi:regulator of chromosome condensation 1/beta-lactamase-inhibitor protein II [Abortiporus biennis]|nr:regulator of chromosome condensation 1/beta-lactamase-inhibitor protein II [Abortiporus biennis]
MPPRRSARAASAKPAEPKPAEKVAKPVAPKAAAPRTRTKRPATPDSDSNSLTPPPPPAKRARSGSKAAAAATTNGVDKKEVKKTTKAAVAPKAAPAKKQEKVKVAEKVTVVKKKAPAAPAHPPKPHFNALPTHAEHIRPAPQLFVWGAGNFGQFGMGADRLGEFEKPRKNPLIEAKIEEGVFGEPGASFEAVAAGGLHSLFVDEKGTVWSCGVNDDAALGRVTNEVPNPEKPDEFLDIDTLTAQPYPLQSLADEGFRAVRIAAGDTISAAISDKGELRVWGSFRGVEGVLGFSSGHKHQFLPTSILDIKSKPNDPELFTAVAAGNNHLLVLTTHGNLYTWGAGEQGQLGRKVLERRKIHGTVPEKIVLGSRTHKAVIIGAGNYTSFAVDERGEVWAWGLNNKGQTGTGFSNSSQDGEIGLPKKVIGLSKEDLGGEDSVVEITGGEHHTIFLTAKGRVFSCGRSDGGQLGIADDDEALKDRAFPDMLEQPAEIKFPDADDPIVHISTGIHNNMAISKAGALYCWGTGPQGELGAGDDFEITTPRMIVRKEGGSWAAVSVSCGGQHTLGLFRKKN